MIDTSEADFEEFIFNDLTEQGGYYARETHHYDRHLCLDPEMVIAFLQTT